MPDKPTLVLLRSGSSTAPERTLFECYRAVVEAGNLMAEAFERLDDRLKDPVTDPFMESQVALSRLRSRVVEAALHEGEVGWL